jgi:hypothetical protein
MKRIMISLAILLTILTSYCDKEEVLEQSECIEIFKNSNWTTEEFKSNYEIQFSTN